MCHGPGLAIATFRNPAGNVLGIFREGALWTFGRLEGVIRTPMDGSGSHHLRNRSQEMDRGTV